MSILTSQPSKNDTLNFVFQPLPPMSMCGRMSCQLTWAGEIELRVMAPPKSRSDVYPYKFCESICLNMQLSCQFIGKKACWISFYPVNNIFEPLRLALRGSEIWKSQLVQFKYTFEILWIRIRVFRPDPDPNLSKYPDPTGSGSETLVYTLVLLFKIRIPICFVSFFR